MLKRQYKENVETKWQKIRFKLERIFCFCYQNLIAALLMELGAAHGDLSFDSKIYIEFSSGFMQHSNFDSKKTFIIHSARNLHEICFKFALQNIPIMKHFNYSYTSFSNIQSIFGLFNLIHSQQFKDSFVEMAKDDFDIDFAELEKEDAQLFLGLINTSDVLLFGVGNYPEFKTIIPVEVLAGLDNVSKKLKPFEDYLKGIFTGTMTNAEVEHKLLVWGTMHLNNSYLHSQLESL